MCAMSQAFYFIWSSIYTFSQFGKFLEEFLKFQVICITLRGNILLHSVKEKILTFSKWNHKFKKFTFFALCTLRGIKWHWESPLCLVRVTWLSKLKALKWQGESYSIWLTLYWHYERSHADVWMNNPIFIFIAFLFHCLPFGIEIQWIFTWIASGLQKLFL